MKQCMYVNMCVRETARETERGGEMEEGVFVVMLVCEWWGRSLV